MRTTFLANLLAISSLFAPGFLCAGQQMYVSICNKAGVAEKTIARAQAEIEIIYQTVGAEVSWVGCETVPTASTELRERLFVIRLLRRVPAFTHGNVSLETMGRAYTNERGVGFLADAYVPSIDKFADSMQVEAGVLLGVVISHELGHLLLGPGHVPQGIMYGQWNSREVQAIHKRWLRFGKQQGSVIQVELEKRAQASR